MRWHQAVFSKKFLHSRVIYQFVDLVDVLLRDILDFTAVIIFTYRRRPISAIDRIRPGFVRLEGVQVVTQQILGLVHDLLKERVRRNREIALHFVQVVHGEEEHFGLLNTLHAEVAPIILLKPVL